MGDEGREVRGFHGRYSVGEGRTGVELRARGHGRDLVATLGGGDAHAGAVALASPGGGIGGEPCSGGLLVPGHREGPLAREFADRLAAATGVTCVVIAGIHVDDATPDEIDAIVVNAREALSRLIKDL